MKIYFAFSLASILALINFFPANKQQIEMRVNYFQKLPSNENEEKLPLQTKNEIKPLIQPDNLEEIDDQNLINFASTGIDAKSESIFLPLMLQNQKPQNDGFTQAVSYDFLGINFSDKERRITIEITPPDRRINHGHPITIQFRPGETCLWGEKRACVYSMQTDVGQQIILISIHSGVGGEAQGFRHALEGTGINRAGNTFSQTIQNMKLISGSIVKIKQGKNELSSLTLRVVSRIPPGSLETYMNLPADEALTFASEIDPLLDQALGTGLPQIIIETCGWRMPGEEKNRKISATSSSIYLGVIQPSLP